MKIGRFFHRLPGLFVLLLFLAACRPEPVVVERTVAVQREVAVTATAETAAVTPAPGSGDQPEPASPMPTSPPTATLLPLQATIQAMTEMMPTRVPVTVESIAADDYPALLDDACQIVDENYVRGDFNGVDWPAVCAEYHTLAESVTSSQEFWALMADFINELGDDHSNFLPPDQFAVRYGLPQVGEQTPWPGLTIWPAKEDEQLLLWDVCLVGPAASAGLRRGDIVLAINGETMAAPFDGVAVTSALYARDDTVTLTVRRGPNSEPEEIVVDFDTTAAGCDGWQYGILKLTPRIGYIRLPNFGNIADSNVQEAIDLMEADGPLEGLILDVRHNPGGNADRTLPLFTSGDFGLQGPLRDDATLTVWRIRGPVRWSETVPIVVLIDGNSHSAAEYFATAMQQSGRATLIGMPTAGNTEGKIPFNLPDGSLIELAVSILQLPDGSSLEGVGVQPDLRVSLGDWGLYPEIDVQLQAAIDYLLGTGGI